MSDRGDDRYDRVLGLPQVTISGVAVIIGAGIFVLLGPATQKAGGWVWLAFVVAAALSALTAFSYMELSSMYPRASAEHEFARQLYPRWVSATVGTAMSLALIVAAATVALGFSRYLNEFVAVDVRVAAVGIIGVCAVLSALGVERAVWVVVLLGIVEIGTLVVVSVIGLPSVNVSELTTGTGPGGIVAGAALVFFAFIGFDEVITLAEETRDPTRTIPRAVLLSLFVSTILYVAVAVSSVSVLGADRLAVSATPLADVIAVVAGDAAGRIVAVGALVSTSSTVLLLLTAGARMVYGMGSVGDLPQILGTVHKRRTPTWALVTCVVVAVALVAVRDLGLLAEATDGLVYAIFLVVNSVVIGLRFRRPDAARPFRVAGAIGRFPVVPALAIVVTIAVGSQLRAEAMLFAGVLLGGAALAHLAGRSMTGSRGIRRSGS